MVAGSLQLYTSASVRDRPLIDSHWPNSSCVLCETLKAPQILSLQVIRCKPRDLSLASKQIPLKPPRRHLIILQSWIRMTFGCLFTPLFWPSVKAFVPAKKSAILDCMKRCISSSRNRDNLCEEPTGSYPFVCGVMVLLIYRFISAGKVKPYRCT